MARGKRVQHWKHGWIPISPEAKAYVAGRGPRPGTGRLRDGVNPVGKDFRNMTPAEKKRAGEIMFGTAPKKPRPKTSKQPSVRDVLGGLADDPVVKRSMNRKGARPRPTDPLSRVLDTPPPPKRKQMTKAQFEAELEKAGQRIEARKTAADLSSDDKLARQLARRKIAQKAMGFQVDTVDGVDFVEYEHGRDEMDLATGRERKLTKAQKREVAATVNEIRGRFPKMKPVRIVADDDQENYGVTEWDGSRITLSKIMWDDGHRYNAMSGREDSLINQWADEGPAFRKAIITHEMGHALQMQNAEARRQLEKIADEKVHPATDFGLDEGRDVGMAVPRWSVDTLKPGANNAGPIDGQSFYALGNKWEWAAEAFTDAYLHTEQPMESPYDDWANQHHHPTLGLPNVNSIRVLETLHNIYGGEL